MKVLLQIALMSLVSTLVIGLIDYFAGWDAQYIVGMLAGVALVKIVERQHENN